MKLLRAFGVRSGRLRHALRLSAVPLLLSGILVGTAWQPASAQSLTMTAIGPLSGGTQSIAYGISSTGSVVGSSTVAGGATHAFLWTPSTPNGTSGTIKDLGLLPGGTFSIAYGVNSTGQVVGEADTTNHAVHAFLYSGTSMTDLGTLGGSNSVAYAINNSAQIVGEADTVSGNTHGFLGSTAHRVNSYAS